MKISSYKEVFVNDFNVSVKVEIKKVEKEGTSVYFYSIFSLYTDRLGFVWETLLYEGSVVSDEDLSFSVLPNQAFEMTVGESVLFRLHPISLALRW